MKRPFRQPAQAEKNKWKRPSEPGRFFLLPKTQPENDRERAKRNIKASISTSRPFSMIPALISQMSAAIVDPRGPRLGRATVTKASATKRTEMTDGMRAVHSFWCPEILNEAATSQLISGGFRK